MAKLSKADELMREKVNHGLRTACAVFAIATMGPFRAEQGLVRPHRQPSIA
jgi:hypothetical protein